MTATVSPSIRLDASGYHRGYLAIGDSTNASGWAMASVPLVSIKSGSGPTVLLVGGSHGDEYEGPFAIAALLREVTPADISGQLIALPALSPSAASQGTRLLPDGTDLDRRFPGDERGTVADKLVHFLAHELIPQCDAVVEITSGGRGLRVLPSATVTWDGDDDSGAPRRSALLAAMSGWQLPTSMLLPVLPGLAHASGLAGYASALGRSVYTAIVGGGGVTSAESNRAARRGLASALRHALVLDAQWQGSDGSPPTPPASPVIIDVRTETSFHWAREPGIFECTRSLGEPLVAGDVVGFIHDPESADRPALPLAAACTGILGMIRGYPRVRRGDLCAVIGRSDSEVWAREKARPPAPRPT